jgi:hypothetical protein
MNSAAMLDRRISVSFGNRAADNQPKTEDLTIREFCLRLKQPRRGKKDGPYFLQGVTAGERNKQAMDVLYMWAGDIENGDSFDDVQAKLKASGLLYCIYETYSNLSTVTDIAESLFKKHRDALGSSDVEVARHYFGAVKHWTSEMLASVSGVTHGRRKDGKAAFLVVHAPMPRLRVVLFLREPFRFLGEGRLQSDRVAEWSRSYLAVAQTLGLVVDQSCADASRLMYLPAHGAEAQAPRVLIGPGDWLDLPEAEAPLISAKPGTALAPVGPTEAPALFEPRTKGLRKFAARFAQHFDAVRFFEDDREPRHRYEDGHADFACPNEDAHTDPNEADRAFTVWSGDGHRAFEMYCHHAGCQHAAGKSDRLQLLDIECANRGIGHARDLLAWCPGLNPSDFDDPAKAATPVVDDDPANWWEWPFIVRMKDGTTHADHGHPGNTEYLLARLGGRVRWNAFAERREVAEGSGWRRLDDRDYREWWTTGRANGYRPRLDTFRSDVMAMAEKASVDPLLEYLRDCAERWDRKPRIDTWLSDYLGAADTASHRAFGRVFLLGAVWRALEPGCQFDTMLVLEGGQGLGKSSALRTLAGGTEYFTDELKLGSDSRTVIEKTRGKWIVEIAELAGMGGREIEAIKAMITCRVDLARLAYGFEETERPRRLVLAGTTNEVGAPYLRDQTGNRRFLPVPVGKIDVARLGAERDMLWGEAVAYVLIGEQAYLQGEAEAMAIAAQAARTTVDPIAERLEELFAGVPSGRIEKEQVWRALGLQEVAKRGQSAMNVTTRVMKKLGWHPCKHRLPSRSGTVNCFEKRVGEDLPVWLMIRGGEVVESEQCAADLIG